MYKADNLSPAKLQSPEKRGTIMYKPTKIYHVDLNTDEENEQDLVFQDQYGDAVEADDVASLSELDDQTLSQRSGLSSVQLVRMETKEKDNANEIRATSSFIDNDRGNPE